MKISSRKNLEIFKCENTERKFVLGILFEIEAEKRWAASLHSHAKMLSPESPMENCSGVSTHAGSTTFQNDLFIKPNTNGP